MLLYVIIIVDPFLLSWEIYFSSCHVYYVLVILCATNAVIASLLRQMWPQGTGYYWPQTSSNSAPAQQSKLFSYLYGCKLIILL